MLQQKGKRVRDHVGIFQDICNSAGILDERQMITLLWDSFDVEITKGLYRRDLTPESCKMEELINEAEKVEMIENARKKTSHYQPKPEAAPKENSGSGTSKKSGNSWNGQSQKKKDSNIGQNNNGKGVSGSASKDDTSKPKKHTESKAHQLTPEQKNKYRAAGKCFECGEVTHKARDCPKENRIKGDPTKVGPPGFLTNNIEWELVDCTSALKEVHKFSANNIKFDWWEDIEQTYYSNNGCPHTEVTEKNTDSESIDYDDPLPDLVSVSDSGSEGDLNDMVDCTDCLHSYFECMCWTKDAAMAKFTNPEREEPTLEFQTIEIKKKEQSLGEIRDIAEAQMAGSKIRKCKPARSQFGDPIARRVEHLLSLNAPFTGEAPGDAEDFICYQIMGEKHIILNTGRGDSQALEGSRYLTAAAMGDARGKHIMRVLNNTNIYPCSHIPGWEVIDDPNQIGNRFWAFASESKCEHYVIWDTVRNLRWELPELLLYHPQFDVIGWVYKKCITLIRTCSDWDFWEEEGLLHEVFNDSGDTFEASNMIMRHIQMGDMSIWRAGLIHLNAVQIPADKYPGVQRNAARVKDPNRRVARPLVIAVRLNGEPVAALLDSGSLGTFLELNPPLTLQLAVQGSRSKINCKVEAQFQYQGIDEVRSFDIANINYPLILGTDWMYEHSVSIGFNQARVVIGSNKRLPLNGPMISEIMANYTDFASEDVEKIRNELREYAKPLCRMMAEPDLPPLRDINHRIPLIDESLIIPW
ncbi:hypothetical protein F5050DRAFT_1807010 [Lentinula boryana]|uniref:CCHC-type domain-containing protein n=1 Tax=Lentinula boryana TaxID=40481 RepID=A0ABQ8QFJ0_9AGAR|nr:hypothetical protein F5050DRAFT_1807010 [Lentinula boryana]